MNNIITKIFAVIIIATTFAACNKHSHTGDESDTTKPIITVAEPLANDTLSLIAEPEIHIEFTATDETNLHALNILLIKGTNDTLLNDSPTVHNLQTYAYHQHLMPTGISTLTLFTAILTAEDHNENKEVKTITFYVTP